MSKPILCLDFDGVSPTRRNQEVQAMEQKLGATGDFPHGKVNASDEGELRFAIGEENDNVMIRFGKPIHWLAMSPEQAVAMAQLLIAKARIVARKLGRPLIVSL